MEKRKLTKEDIDKVRGIEGFPIGSDEDIIALSDAPYYTACPNPFIEEFIKENGHPYDKETDDYHCEPYTSEVSEGKHDPMYMAHGYHTKVPYKAIMRYILHYTKPGDIVYDGFCGTGMTGVAALMCANPDYDIQQEALRDNPETKFGVRHAILNDLSVEAGFIAHNYNTEADINSFAIEAKRILEKLRSECGWVYTTKDNHSSTMFVGPQEGSIDYTIWSDIYICPYCGAELKYWDISVNEDESAIAKPVCPKCSSTIKKDDCEKALTFKIDEATGQSYSTVKQYPVRIAYSVGKKRYTKKPDEFDLSTIEKIENMKMPYWFPSDLMMGKGENWGDSWRAGYHLGMTRVHHFYTKRNLFVLSTCNKLINEVENERTRSLLMFWMSSIYSRSHRLNRYMPNHHRHVGPLSGTLYIPFFQAEINIIDLLEAKVSSIVELRAIKGNSIVSTQSTVCVPNIPNNSIDYIFTDPPFGDNLNYSELNFIQESWLKSFTQNSSEAIINSSQGKSLVEYQALMEACFKEYYRVLKPNRWITVEFHNSKNAVWNAIQETLQKSGFIVADVRTLDKQKGTTKQLSNTSAVKQDLVITAYKPKEDFAKEFVLKAGNEKTAWSFVRQHLSNLPITVKKGGRLEVLSERQAFLLWDRMVAYHIMRGIAVPMDAADFYRGLDEKYLKRDGMYFLPNQVNKYDKVRATCEVENIQFSLFVSDEKSAIGWLYQQLDLTGDGPQTYQELMPKFMQELKAVDKREKMPELMVILEENFLKDDDGKWYIPDYTKSGDIAKLREKNLLKEFAEYQQSKGKLKQFRSEAIRAGFSKLWKDKDYRAIVEMAERLPEETIQEDSNLLMYYDISLSRAEAEPSQLSLNIN